MSDPTKKPLQLPAWHIPYLEKHKIYELFYEIARELVIQKPADHVLFMKQILQNAANSKDVPRILLLSTPHVNCLNIAKEISRITGQIVISHEEIKQYLGGDIDDIPSDILVKSLATLVRSQNCYTMGWIMVNCIRDETDAKYLVKAGILPTHTILIVAPLNPDLTSLLYCNVKTNWPNYRRNIIAIKDIFKTTINEIYLEQKETLNIVQEIVSLSKNRKAHRTGIKRVLILGPRGSGRKTQAKLLAQNFNLVFIDFEYLLCSAWISPTEFGDKLRQCRNEICFHSEVLTQIVNKRILESDCLKNGWVMTGYPFTLTDFKYLDCLDTPPNRVIFLECEINLCKDRLLNRRVNVYTGSTTDVKENPSAEQDKVLRIHPKDGIDMITAELNFYCENYGALRKYCGNTASLVNGNQSERNIHEYIMAILLRDAPVGPPRSGTDYLDSVSSSDDQCDCLPIAAQVLDCFIKKL